MARRKSFTSRIKKFLSKMNCGIKLKSKPKKNRGKTYIPSPIDTNRAKATPTSGPGTPEETDRANKVKTAVTYREILEKLPQPDGGRASPRWKKFWESLDLNFESSCSLPLSHPLRPLWEKYNSKDKLTQKNLLETGSDLYRILSAIVHSPRINNYDIFHGHWSQELEDILRALEPDPSIPNIRGEPDWDKQRERFQIKVEDKVNQSTANKNPERSRKEKKPDNADQEQIQVKVIGLNQTLGNVVTAIDSLRDTIVSYLESAKIPRGKWRPWW